MTIADDRREMLPAVLMKPSEGEELTHEDLSCCRSSSLTR